MICRGSADFRRRGVCAIALTCCLCVIMQMLGMPVTLLFAGDLADEFSGPVLEGLSLPQTPSPLAFAPESRSAIELTLSVHLPVPMSEQVHPPAF